MASLFVMTKPPTNIDYSLVDRRVTSFELRGNVLFDEDEGIQEVNWKEELVYFIKEQGLHQDDGMGLHAFIYKLQDEGLLGGTNGA